MEHLCARCTRQALRSTSLPRRSAPSMLIRHLSATSLRAAGPIDLSQALGGTDNEKPRAPRKDSAAKDPGAPSFRITRTATDSPRAPRSPSQSKPAGQVIARRVPGKGTVDPQRVLSRNTNSPQPPPGTVVARRTTTPRSGPPSAAGSRAPQRGPRRGPSSSGGNSNTSNDPRRRRALAEDPDNTFDEYVEEEDSPLKQYEDKIAAAEANNGLPTEPIDYSPAEQTFEELRKDWPDTPLSATGLTEAVVQKFRWLARDLPHGYWTPRQIAERFVKGGLVRFEDEEHKQKVMVWVERMLVERGLEEKSGAAGTEEEAEKALQRFLAVEQNGSWQSLVDSLVKGHYPELPSGQRPVIASVQRQLRNNESYSSADSSKLVGRINSLIASLQSQAAQQRGPASQKEAA